MKLKFKACPKCRGDLELRRDIYGIFVSCLQCGLQRDLDAPVEVIDVNWTNSPTTGATAGQEELLQVA